MKEVFYKVNIKKMIFLLFFLTFLQGLHSKDNFEKGKMLLKADKIEQAIAELFTASKEEGTPPSVYLYLGVAYFRIGKYPESLNYLTIGQAKDVLNDYIYSYNIGNIYFLENRFELCEHLYTNAINSNGSYAPAFLNRANTRINLKNLEGALQDYKIYLNLAPNTIQRQSIEKIISLLEHIIQEDFRVKAFAEAQKAAEEAQRRAAEERYKKLIDEINSNLLSVEAADAVSAGAEETIDYSEENELD